MYHVVRSLATLHLPFAKCCDFTLLGTAEPCDQVVIGDTSQKRTVEEGFGGQVRPRSWIHSCEGRSQGVDNEHPTCREPDTHRASRAHLRINYGKIRHFVSDKFQEKKSLSVYIPPNSSYIICQRFVCNHSKR